MVQATHRRLFEEAGITTGMKVLDVGSGAGDVAFLAAELVGPTGTVVGVDMDPAVVRTARARAQAAHMTNVSFTIGDVREVQLEHDFDAVVGRLVLLYSADPVDTLLAALGLLQEQGVVAFYEADMGAKLASFPVSRLHQLLGHCVNEAFARGGVELAMGTKLYQVFLAAGLEAPHLSTDALLGGGRDWMERFASTFGANLWRTILPSLVQQEVVTEGDIDVETFDRRYVEEVVNQRSVIQWFPFVGAWARKHPHA